MLLLVGLVLGLSAVGDAVLADTWDTCNCTFQPWQPWGTCTTNCFGQRVRERNVSYSPNAGCDDFTDCATIDERFEWGSCNTVCQNGGTPTGKTASPCSCRNGFYGECCTSLVDCGMPRNITHGYVSASSTTYGQNVTYHCIDKYNVTNGDRIRTCQHDFTWGGVEPECVFADNCSSSPCKNGATCVDLFNSYTCQCAQGWSGPVCEADVMAPDVTGCSDDVVLNTSSNTVTYSWNEPTFTDPMGLEINVTSNYPTPEYEFPWGDNVVTYTATKLANGQQSHCTFIVKVRPNQCEDLNVPQHGARLCNGWRTDFGRYCMITCLKNYTLGPTLSFRTWRVCGASGTWLASAPLPDCRLRVNSESEAEFYQQDYATFSFSTTCHDQATHDALRKLYIDQLKNHKGFSKVCTEHPDECVPGNVDVVCNL